MTYDDLVYMMRWGAYAPRVAEIASLNVTVRKKGSLARDTSHPGVGDPKATTRCDCTETDDLLLVELACILGCNIIAEPMEVHILDIHGWK